MAPPFVKLIFLLIGILPVLETAFDLRITLIMRLLLGIGYLKGVPDSSTHEEPYVTYPVSGVFDVDLAASGDSVNFLSEQKNDLIVVMNYNGEQLPFFEGFENTTITTPEWVSSIGNWDLTNQTSYNGSYCIKVDNAGTIPGAKHEIESKTFDLSDTTKAYFI